MSEPVDYRISADGQVEAMHARFRRHVYPLHTHPTYAFGVTEHGAQTFRCRGEQRVSAAGMVMALNPEDPHDGHAAADLGYHYRMLYVAEGIIGDVLGDAADHPVGAPLFVEPVFADDRLAAAIRDVSLCLSEGDRLAYSESLLPLVLGITRRGSSRSVATRTPDGRLAAARDRLLSDPGVSLDELAEEARTSRYGLYRGFRQVFGLPPSQYRRQLRLRQARHWIAAGVDLAEVAVRTEFADQAHLTRWFLRFYGITPGRYRVAAGGSVTDSVTDSVDEVPAVNGSSAGTCSLT